MVREGNCVFFFQAEDGIRVLVRSRGLGDVYKGPLQYPRVFFSRPPPAKISQRFFFRDVPVAISCPSYISDAADDPPPVDPGGGRTVKKKKKYYPTAGANTI